MDNSKKWYQKWWIWLIVGVGVIGTIFGVPLVINYFYTKVDFCPTDWNGGDALQFYGTILSFIGTVLLGALALWQNKEITKIEEKTFFRDCSCNIIITQEKNMSTTTLSNEEDESYAHNQLITINVYNHGNAFLQKIKLNFGNNNIFTSHICVAKGESKKVNIGIPSSTNDKINFTFYSCYGVETYANLKIEKKNTDIKLLHYHYTGLETEDKQND